MLERLAEANPKKVRIIKVDVYENSEWAAQQGIRSVPTIQFYRKGAKVYEFSGSYPEHVIQQQIDQHSQSWGGEKDEDGNPVQPAIQPMPKKWLPPGVTEE